jgi:hypothetical protein
MQAAVPTLREHEQPMSWARALMLATGFFFLAAILIAQIPGYFYTVSTLSTLARFEQGTLDLGLLAVGFGVISMEIAFLYDPRPLLPPALFALGGLVVAAVGAFFDLQVSTGAWHELLPDATVVAGGNTVYWPVADQGYLFNPIWFQPGSIDLAAVGMIAMLIGGGMFLAAVLCRPVLAGRLAGATGALIVRLCLAAAIAVGAVYITLLTFAPTTVLGDHQKDGAVGNVLLFLALCAALAATLIWLLPIMVARRQQFMPGVYLHGVIGLLGTVGVPLLVIWAAVYPVVYGIHQLDSTQFFVQCSQKTVIPGSCTFTPYTGYIITALVVGLTFQVCALGIYFWSTRRNTVVLGATYGIIFLGLAGTVVHVDTPAQLPIGLFLALAIALLAFAFVWASQREFSVERAEALGCTGQWLVVGTGVLVYLAGFSVFSFPSFFESEALGLNYVPGSHTIHDAFWGALLLTGLVAMQLVLLTRRQPMSQLRKFIMWSLLAATTLELAGAIMGFNSDILSNGWDVAEGSHAIFVGGLCVQAAGLLAAFFGTLRAASLRWFLITAVPVLVGGAIAYVAYYWPGDWAEIVVFGFILCSVGALAFAVAGPDWPMVRVPAPDASQFVVGSTDSQP